MSVLADGLSRPPRDRRLWLTRGRVLASTVILACFMALLVAHGSEIWLGLVPCAFCLLERVPYRIGAALGVIAMLLPPRLARWALWAAIGVLAVAAGLSFVHVGVEQHWWPDPLPACSVPDFTGMTASQRLMAMPSRPAKPCEDPDFLITGVPISMAQMGCAYALAVCAGLAMWMPRNRGHAR